MIQPKFDFLGELKNLCVKIPLIQAIKDVPIIEKYVREPCLKKPRRKRKDPQTIHVIGQLVDLMLGKVFVPKYFDLGSPIVNIHIANKLITNTLIDLGETINVMTKDTLEKLELQGLLRQTPTMFFKWLIDPLVKPEGMLEDIIVSIDSWEYPIYFMVLQTKSRLGGYPLILGRPWLAIVDAYIGCREGDMTISNGKNS
jgi:hypothetical protein